MAPEIERKGRGRWHRTDWMALLSGMIFIVAGIVLVNRPSIEPLIALPVVLGALGVAGLVAIIVRAVRH